MGIVNRRNAMLGWTVWQVAKRVAEQKARAVAPPADRKRKGRGKSAIIVGLAAVGGLLVFWRKKNAGDEFPPSGV